MIKTDSLSLLSCLPLVVLLFWQGSSCHSKKSNQNQVVKDNQAVVKDNQANASQSNANAGQATVRNSSSPPATDITGTWGAQGIAMTVTTTGAQISYDCAHGSITEKIVLDSQGHFSVHGRHVREHGGPIRDDEDQSGRAATYRGSISGEKMTLTVSLDADETVGTFTLTHGSSGRLRRCL